MRILSGMEFKVLHGVAPIKVNYHMIFEQWIENRRNSNLLWEVASRAHTSRNISL